MDTKRSFYLMTATVTFLFCVLLASVVMGDLWLQKQSKKLLAIKLENRLIDEQQSAIVRAKKDIQKYSELEKIAKTIVPQDKDQAKTVREIVSIADANGIPISSVAFPSSSLGSTATPSSSSSSGSSTSTPSSSAPSSGAASTPAAAPSITQVTAVSGMTGVYQMLITVQSNSSQPVSYNSFINFLRELEKNRRTAQVSNLVITPFARDPSRLTFTLGITVYLRP